MAPVESYSLPWRGFGVEKALVACKPPRPLCLCLPSREGAHCALCLRCAKSRLFSTTSSYGSQGPEFCTPFCFEFIMHASVGGWFSGGVPGINNVLAPRPHCACAVRKRPESACCAT